MGSLPHVLRAVDRHKVRAGTKGDTHAAMERGYVNAPHLLKMSSSTIEVEKSKQIYFDEGRNQQKKTIDWPKYSFPDLWIFHLKIQISRRKTAISLGISYGISGSSNRLLGWAKPYEMLISDDWRVFVLPGVVWGPSPKQTPNIDNKLPQSAPTTQLFILQLNS